MELITVTELGKTGYFQTVIDYLKTNTKPIVQTYALLSDELFEVAKMNGVRILLSGFGGDEGVTIGGTVYLNEIANQKKWKVLFSALKQKVEKNSGNLLWQFIKYFFKGCAPIIIKIIRAMNPFYQDFYKNRSRKVALNKTLRKKLNVYRRLSENGILSAEPNLRLRQYRRITSGFVSDKLENSYYEARKRKIEYRYPFIDVKLIEFFYSLNSDLKYRNGINRYLFRMAMEGILDDRIRMNLKKRGVAIPYLVHRLMQDEEMLRDVINEAEKNYSFHYIDYKRLRKMLKLIKTPGKSRNNRFSPEVFFPAISVLLLQKWQRNGLIEIGIRK
ncbi:MAG TPA: hypothetical protein ENO27_03535 [Caldithrix sp.]|nr:hypothetical protein [Caldithrix sp.]